MRKVLLVAFHFPPIQGSTGITRTLAFSRYLRDFGWDVCVLTIRPEAYEDTSPENELLIPEHVRVERAWGVDTRHSLSIKGRYPLALALPDRWQSWIAGAWLKGSRIVREWRPDLVMSTYPIASAQVIGSQLAKRFALPWIAELRDPMMQENYPARGLHRWSFRNVEQRIFASSSAVIVTTGGCKKLYEERYPHYDPSRIRLISNGFDPVMFGAKPPAGGVESTDGRKVLLHSGLLYPHERNPAEFFKALSRLKERGELSAADVEFRFRASGNEARYRQQVEDLGIHDLVRFLPRLPYADAVREMQEVDALMLFQADNCNLQIPAKVYEYLYSGKPIVGFADPAGDTGGLLRSLGIESVAKLENAADIDAVVRRFLTDLAADAAYTVPSSEVGKFSRENLTGELSALFDTVCESGRLGK